MNNLEEIENYFNKLNIGSHKEYYQSPGNTDCLVLYLHNPTFGATLDNIAELIDVKFPDVKYKKEYNNIAIYDTIFSYQFNNLSNRIYTQFFT